MTNCKWEVGEWYLDGDGYAFKIISIECNASPDYPLIAINKSGGVASYTLEGVAPLSEENLTLTKCPDPTKPKPDETKDKLHAKIRDIRDLCDELEGMV